MAGDFNTDMDVPESRKQEEGIAAALEEEVLDDISIHFLPRHKPWLRDIHKWAIHRDGR